MSVLPRGTGKGGGRSTRNLGGPEFTSGGDGVAVKRRTDGEKRTISGGRPKTGHSRKKKKKVHVQGSGQLAAQESTEIEANRLGETRTKKQKLYREKAGGGKRSWRLIGCAQLGRRGNKNPAFEGGPSGGTKKLGYWRVRASLSRGPNLLGG